MLENNGTSRLMEGCHIRLGQHLILLPYKTQEAVLRSSYNP